MIYGNINSITRLRINTDGTGVRSVIFMQGCPLNCFWCCNPETRFGTNYKTLNSDTLYRYIRTDIPYFIQSGGGITFSGGEPLQQADFIKDFVQEYCADFAVDIETSLYATSEALEQLIPIIDVWNVDFKIADEASHIHYTGFSNQTILKNLSLLAKRIPAERIIITFPIIPGCNDSLQQLSQMLDFMKRNGLYRIELHPYRKFAEEKQRKYNLTVRPINALTNAQLRKIRFLLMRKGMSIVHKRRYYNKKKCRYLKKLRKQICKTHNISVSIPKCKFKGNCIGTCPQCESELQIIGSHLITRNAERGIHHV